MRVLFIGDIHYKHNNINETTILLEKLRENNEPYDFAVLAGDLLDTHEIIDIQLMNRAYELIRVLKEKSHVFVCVGNHDMINNQQFLTENHWMNGMKEWRNVTIVDKTVQIHGFLFVPYVFPGRFVEALNSVCGWEKATCIFAHQEFRGCKMGAIESFDGDVWSDASPLVISGHIHDRHQPQRNIIYPGAVIENGFSIFSFDESGSMHEKRIPLGIAQRKTVHIKVGQGVKVSDMVQGTRVVITGTSDEIASHKKSKQNDILMKKGIKVVYKLNRNDKPLNINAGKSFSVILERLITDAKDENLTKDYLLVTK